MSQLSSIADLRADALSSALLNPEASQAPDPGAFGAVFDLSSLDGSNGFRIDGEHDNDRFGFSVASAGDFNGDGFADLIIGTPRGDDPDGVLASPGAAYVIFGHAGGFDPTFDAGALDGTNGFKVVGLGDYQGIGYSVASAGDVNGDGFDDVMIGSEAYRGGPQVDYVVFGTDSHMAAEFDLTKINGKNGFAFFDSASSIAKVHVACAGDFNGDGLADLIVSDFETGSYGGSSWVVFGKAGKFASPLDLAHLNGKDGFRIPGVAQNGELGRSVSSAGDVNGDGFDDIVIGAPTASSEWPSSEGSAYVVFGTASRMSSSFDLNGLDGSNGFRVDGAHDSDQIGSSVSSAGDINGDGFADLIIGTFYASSVGSFSGASYVVFGKSDGFAATFDTSSLNGANGFQIVGPAGEQELGYSVASAGDVNGDGFDDLIIGQPLGFDGAQTQTGSTYVVFGKAGGFPSLFDLTTLNGANGFKIEGVEGGDQSGWSVASAGDVNGDGLDDMIVGAVQGHSHGYGASYVIFGVAPTKAVHLTGTAASQSLVGGELKDVLSGLGGDDMLWGHGGKDKLTGGTGDDTLVGGAGKDVLIGSAGADVFQYRDLADSTAKAHDTIKGIGKTDVIDLHLLDADAGTDGDQAFHLVSAFSHQAGELTVSYDGKQTLVQGDVNGDGTADLVIAISGDHHDFANFVL